MIYKILYCIGFCVYVIWSVRFKCRLVVLFPRGFLSCVLVLPRTPFSLLSLYIPFLRLSCYHVCLDTMLSDLRELSDYIFVIRRLCDFLTCLMNLDVSISVPLMGRFISSFSSFLCPSSCDNARFLLKESEFISVVSSCLSHFLVDAVVIESFLSALVDRGLYFKSIIPLFLDRLEVSDKERLKLILCVYDSFLRLLSRFTGELMPDDYLLMTLIIRRYVSFFVGIKVEYPHFYRTLLRVLSCLNADMRLMVLKGDFAVDLSWFSTDLNCVEAIDSVSFLLLPVERQVSFLCVASTCHLRQPFFLQPFFMSSSDRSLCIDRILQYLSSSPDLASLSRHLGLFSQLLSVADDDVVFDFEQFSVDAMLFFSFFF